MCGIAGLISFEPKAAVGEFPLSLICEEIDRLDRAAISLSEERDDSVESSPWVGSMDRLVSFVRVLKTRRCFSRICLEPDLEKRTAAAADRVTQIIDKVSEACSRKRGTLTPRKAASAARQLEGLRDARWCLEHEVLENVSRVRKLCLSGLESVSQAGLFGQVNSVLNAIDRLEVRGRDSAGLSVALTFNQTQYRVFQGRLAAQELAEEFSRRSEDGLLVNRSIEVAFSGDSQVVLALTYKVSAEIGSLGDNVGFLRRQIQSDPILKLASVIDRLGLSVLSHTRWASVGAVSEANCHPVSNQLDSGRKESSGTIIHVCLNGDIDNYLDLKQRLEQQGKVIPDRVTTDTKVIPLWIERYLEEGFEIEEAFRRSVNDFEGSHAIAMQTSLRPGKMFLAQRGSGQALFVGLGEDHLMASSEVYGLIEGTSRYIKLDGEKLVQGNEGVTQGQILVLDSDSSGGLEGIHSSYYDGTPSAMEQAAVKESELTSRDIDRRGFPHYFMKEISEAPLSVEKTLEERWRFVDAEQGFRDLELDETVVPKKIRAAIEERSIRRIFFVGQGTAGVAAQACSNLARYYLPDSSFQIEALKASELSGFSLANGRDAMEDALVVAISQSGTTTDTNRAVDLVRERGAHTIAIVNRRDSDITFKVDGVLYTSSGRDIEMSVASTKAFYSQIVAGALLGLFLASLSGEKQRDCVAREIQRLLELPGLMRRLLDSKEAIADCARRSCLDRTYWAVVGSGPNKAAADEIRIKLSELCYKSISSDYVEDKKHIDLSSEPLILVCAAGTRETVLADVLKDTAIFKAHKALPVVIVSDEERRFDAYSEHLIRVPTVVEHLAPILNTLAGHLWGYYAALAIHEGSRFFYAFREQIEEEIEDCTQRGLDAYEILLEKSFREKIAQFYLQFRSKWHRRGLPSAIASEAAVDLLLLLKYLSGRLPVTDFEIDFGDKGTAHNILSNFFDRLGELINQMARPIDAIKHQAKTVTVGTSRISEETHGLLFDALAAYGLRLANLTTSNVIVLRNLQRVISKILGATVYRVDGLNILGEPTSETTIEIVAKEGVARDIPSRVEHDKQLQGTKRTIVLEGNVYIGKGRKDNRSILVVPLVAETLSTSDVVENIVLFHVDFKSEVPLADKIKGLGGKYEKLKNLVQESGVSWKDEFLEDFQPDALFGLSAEKVGESIVARTRQ